MTDSLLSRLQALTEPSREIDAEIALANEWKQLSHELWRSPDGSVRPAPPRYTASIDAALTLVPEGLYWFLCAGRTRPDEPLYGAQVVRPSQPENEVIGEAESNTNPAIALLIAIMKAKEETKP